MPASVPASLYFAPDGEEARTARRQRLEPFIREAVRLAMTGRMDAYDGLPPDAANVARSRVDRRVEPLIEQAVADTLKTGSRSHIDELPTQGHKDQALGRLNTLLAERGETAANFTLADGRAARWA